MEEPLPRVRRGGNDRVSRTPLQPDAQYAWRDRIEMSRNRPAHISAGQRAYEVIRSFRQALSALETVVAGECWGNF
jgi:hypothetical protein